LQADERYQEERNKAYISKWLRKPIRQYDSFGISIEGLKSFFKDVKVPYMLPLLVLYYSPFSFPFTVKLFELYLLSGYLACRKG
jgi:hypothetical protein